MTAAQQQRREDRLVARASVRLLLLRVRQILRLWRLAARAAVAQRPGSEPAKEANETGLALEQEQQASAAALRSRVAALEAERGSLQEERQREAALVATLTERNAE